MSIYTSVQEMTGETGIQNKLKSIKLLSVQSAGDYAPVDTFRHDSLVAKLHQPLQEH